MEVATHPTEGPEEIPITAAAATVCRVVIVPPAGETGILDYAVPPPWRGHLRRGMRVLVHLGSRRAIGIVTETTSSSAQPQLKEILGVIDQEPLLCAELFDLCRWIADYYLCSLSEAFSSALPRSVRVAVERVVHRVSEAGSSTARTTAEESLLGWLAEGPQAMPALTKRLGPAARRMVARLRRLGAVRIEESVRPAEGRSRMERYYRAVPDPDPARVAKWAKQRPAVHALFDYLQRHPRGRARSLELRTTFPNAAAKVRALVIDGLVETLEEETYRQVLSDPAPADRIVTPMAAQTEGVRAVTAAGFAFAPFLLWGVTGSGKTEVYMQCIASCLQAGRTVLVLVPEISLTHQLVDRLRARFGERVAVLHSGLSDGERWDEWRRIARGEVDVAVGARSAVFAPLPRLGLVIVDEEHDPAYKQEDGIRYNGRDVAVVRARLAACPVLLGSATPSMETFQNAHIGRYRRLDLPERVEARPLPTIEVIDLRRSRGAERTVLISPHLTAALRANLAAHGQSLVFLNRRGFANFLQCHQCGDAFMCPNCSVALTWHRRWQALQCHHCDHTIPPPPACPHCGGYALGAWGAGTEQVESALRTLVPGARVGRMDRDTTTRKGAQRQILGAWERREYDILVGTQMITKGHDIPGVTLVGVLLADLSLNFPDFRASERTFQLITQVAGRAGRGNRPGRVLVQTLQPEHPSLQYAVQHDFRGFAEQELAARRETGYPPFARLVLVRCEGESAPGTERIARALAKAARENAAASVRVLGPTPSPIERLRGRWRWQLLLRARSSAQVRRVARFAHDAVRRAAQRAGVRVLIDVDPYSML
jgi:primosomal protein N' (replication factor Y)